ncbi:head-tail adaptor protein [Roseobacter weihaiensis]|uniref:head-tail adaptor protein n=1 Tax=Roseobacter weihaiensis TaxID=2763262 RepID=UPI001D0AB64C|nr:head-tail adaptor protein [Roseobacter sp. H9]
MTAPRLSRRLILEAPERVGDGSGGFVIEWQTLGLLWAQIVPRTGRETATSGAAISQMSYRIIVRGAPSGSIERPKPEQRFREGDRLFLIQAVAEEDPEGRYLACFATEETAI